MDGVQPPAVGVVVVGHGTTASQLLEAAKTIAPSPFLGDVVAVDAGKGQTPRLDSAMCQTIRDLDQGRGVVVLVDLLGASPCQCAQRQSSDHDCVLLSGLNLAMLLKLAALDRTSMTPAEVAHACADTAHRSVSLWGAEGGCEAEVAE